MTPLEAFHPFVLPFAPACPIPFVDFQLALTAREICERTNAWRVVDTFTASGGEYEEVAIPPNSSVHEFEFVRFDGHRLDPLQFREAVGGIDTGGPIGYTQEGANSIALVPPSVGEVQISVILKPAVGADYLPDFLLDQYAQEMADGTLARVLALPGQTWSDPQLGLLHRSSFNSAMDREFATGVRGQQRAPVRTRSSYF